jgi:hypothetical protein
MKSFTPRLRARQRGTDAASSQWRPSSAAATHRRLILTNRATCRPYQARRRRTPPHRRQRCERAGRRSRPACRRCRAACRWRARALGPRQHRTKKAPPLPPPKAGPGEKPRKPHISRRQRSNSDERCAISSVRAVPCAWDRGFEDGQRDQEGVGQHDLFGRGEVVQTHSERDRERGARVRGGVYGVWLAGIQDRMAHVPAHVGALRVREHQRAFGGRPGPRLGAASSVASCAAGSSSPSPVPLSAAGSAVASGLGATSSALACG